MRFPFFASFILFIILLRFQMQRNAGRSKEDASSFWEKEARANATRRRSLDTLDDIKIPINELPMHLMEENEEVRALCDTVRRLSESRVVNLTGLSNTELKLRYGAPNLPALMEYDQNYTLLARTLQKWASLLYEAQYVRQARDVLEFAVSTRTDVAATYTLLAKIYRQEGCPEKIDALRETARNLPDISGKRILRQLAEIAGR